MAFIHENISGNSLDYTEEHQKAVSIYDGLPISSRVIDREREALFYCLSVGGGPENEIPGVYLLFLQKNVYKVYAQ